MKSKEMIGMRFGRLVVEEVRPAQGGYVALCRCDCGEVIKTRCSNLGSGMVKSCGCLRRDQSAIKHIGAGRGNFRTLAEKRAEEAEAMSQWTPCDRTQFDDLWMIDGPNPEKWWKEHIV